MVKVSMNPYEEHSDNSLPLKYWKSLAGANPEYVTGFGIRGGVALNKVDDDMKCISA